MCFDTHLSIKYGPSSSSSPSHVELTLSQLARAALTDLTDSSDNWTLVIMPTSDTGPYVELALRDEETGLGVMRGDTEIEFRRGLVDALQEIVIDTVYSARPECLLPGHHHPAQPATAKDDVVWQCPVDPAAWNCRVGEYRSVGRS